MLEFGEKLTVMPSAMAERDLDALRAVGFAERELVGIAAAAAYRNFITRIADGLGVELGVYGDGYYDPAVLRAFGVTERAIGGTLYGDREKPTTAEQARTPSYDGPSRSRIDDRRIAWIDLRDAQPAPDASSSDASFRNLAHALSAKPETREATLEFKRLVDAGGSGLGARSEAIIGLTVAAALALSYLGAHHVQRLLDAGMTPGEVRALIDDPSGGGLAEHERATARFCEKLTREPAAMTRADVEALRAAGLDDGAIVTIVAAASFANYCGRLAAALGVQPEVQLSETARNAI